MTAKAAMSIFLIHQILLLCTHTLLWVPIAKYDTLTMGYIQLESTYIYNYLLVNMHEIQLGFKELLRAIRDKAAEKALLFW